MTQYKVVCDRMHVAEPFMFYSKGKGDFCLTLHSIEDVVYRVDVETNERFAVDLVLGTLKTN